MQTLRARNSDEWTRVCSDTFVPLETSTGRSFEGRIEHMKLASVGLSQVACGPCRVTRGHRAIRRAPVDDILINIVQAGTCTLVAGDGRFQLPSGTVAICHADRPYALNFAAPATVMTLQVSRLLLPTSYRKHTVGRPQALDAGSSSATILRHFLTGVLKAAQNGIDDPDGVLSATLGLVCLAMSAADDQAKPAGHPRDRTAHYLLIRDFIDRHCGDPTITVAEIARRHRVSRRYLENLFADHQHSPAAYVRAKRLERAQVLLSQEARFSLSEVAFRSGFNDVATFRRAFQRHHATAPSAWRRTAARSSNTPATGQP